VLGEAVRGADGLRRRLEDEPGIAQGRERHPPDPVGEALGSLGCGLQRESRLPRPPRAGEREQACVLVGEERQHLGELALPA